MLFRFKKTKPNMTRSKHYMSININEHILDKLTIKEAYANVFKKTPAKYIKDWKQAQGFLRRSKMTINCKSFLGNFNLSLLSKWMRFNSHLQIEKLPLMIKLKRCFKMKARCIEKRARIS